MFKVLRVERVEGPPLRLVKHTSRPDPVMVVQSTGINAVLDFSNMAKDAVEHWRETDDSE